MLVETKRRLDEADLSVELFRVDVAQLPFNSQSLSAVHAGAALHCWVQLEKGLEEIRRVLKPGGRLAVVTFHSLEDRLVKRFLRERSGSEPAGSRHRPAVGPRAEPSFEPPAKAVRPGDDEVARNPRARSATLRVARRTAAALSCCSRSAIREALAASEAASEAWNLTVLNPKVIELTL